MMKTTAHGRQASFKSPDVNIMSAFALWGMTIDIVIMQPFEMTEKDINMNVAHICCACRGGVCAQGTEILLDIR
jgi:hypothetical protein